MRPGGSLEDGPRIFVDQSAERDPAAQPRFVPVEAEQLSVGRALGFTLYIDSQAGAVLFLRAEQPFTWDVRSRLRRMGRRVFVRRQDREKYLTHLEKSLFSVLGQAEVDSTRKAFAAYRLSRHLMAELFEEPTEAGLKRVDRVIAATTDLIVGSDEAFRAALRAARHDLTSQTHSCNVGLLGLGLVKTITGSRRAHDFRSLGRAFFLHDVGKAQIGPEILTKTGPLLEKERALIRRHPLLGHQFLQENGLLTEEASLVVLQHHERLDGSGYPMGLRDKEIHPYAMVCAICDVYDALTSERSYHVRLGPFDAAVYIRDEMAGQFDPGLMRDFILLVREQA